MELEFCRRNSVCLIMRGIKLPGMGTKDFLLLSYTCGTFFHLKYCTLYTLIEGVHKGDHKCGLEAFSRAVRLHSIAGVIPHVLATTGWIIQIFLLSPSLATPTCPMIPQSFTQLLTDRCPFVLSLWVFSHSC